MIYEFLNKENQLKFNKKYEKLELAGKARNATQEETEDFLNKNFNLAFEMFLNQDKCVEIGGIVCADKVFIVGITNSGQILLLDNLNKFLRLKV